MRDFIRRAWDKITSIPQSGSWIRWGVVVFIVLGIATCTMLSRAATFRGDAQTCASISLVAINVVEMRDGGMGWDVFEPMLRGSLDVALQEPESYVKDQDDVRFITRVFKRIFDHPNVDVVAAMTAIEKECMQKPVSIKREKAV